MKELIDSATDHPTVEFQPGEPLIREGDRKRHLFILSEGTVSVYRGDVRISRTSMRGAFFGEMAALLDMPSSASVVAETPVRAIRVEDGRAFLGSRPEIALHAASLLAQRLFDATTYLADLKRQFETEETHLGMVDRVLGSLLNQQLDPAEAPESREADPRL